MAKRTKTYSLDDTAIELVQIMAEYGPYKTQSGVLNQLIYDKSKRIGKKNPAFFRINNILQMRR